MLSRHFLRSKVLQMAYSSYIDGQDAQDTEKLFEHHISRLNDLGTLQLSTLEQFVEVAGAMMDEGQKKFLATEEDKNPNRRLVNNIFLRKLIDNYDYRRHVQAAGVNWGGVENDELFRGAYATMARHAEYQEYLQSEETFENDHEFALKVFRYLMNYPQLLEHIYPQNLLWEDDFDQIAQYNWKMLKGLDVTFDEGTEIPLMCDTRDEGDVEAYEFARQLLVGTLRHHEEVEGMIRSHLQGWEFERVSDMDILLLNMAVAELTECPTIPERVTVDEYIELSKEFSSDRSKLFINGILGKFILELRSAGRIKKTGRGLSEADQAEGEPSTEVAETPVEEETVPVLTVKKTRPRIKKSKVEN